MRAAARVLKQAGFHVRCLATTATEGALTCPISDFLRNSRVAVSKVGRELRFTEQSIFFRLLSTGGLPLNQIDLCFGRAFDAIFRDELGSFRSDAVFTYWGVERDRRRFQLARQNGTKIIYGLRNHAYDHRYCFDLVDAILPPSQALSDYYRGTFGIESTAIPSLMNEDEVLAPRRDPIFITFINPTIGKGVTVMARLAEEHRRDGRIFRSSSSKAVDQQAI